jgi:hypothetical protein
MNRLVCIYFHIVNIINENGLNLFINNILVMSLTIILVEKNATLKTLTVKDFKEADLFKKCGFKKSEDFEKQTQWTCHGYEVSVYGKKNGRATNENKYDFPPPIDSVIFFGTCCIVAKKLGKMENLTLDLWEKIYEKLFGGFEDLSLTALEDEEEKDELEFVAKEHKTKHGYLKDGFVVDSDAEEEYTTETEETEEVLSELKINDSTDESNHSNSELSEESYEE